MKVVYRHVGLENKFMRTAYEVAKAFYKLNSWNKKAMPVCVIADSDNILSIGISGNGMHQMTAHCDRLGKKGAPYTDCKYCVEDMHAEVIAVKKLSNRPYKASAYIYGHYHACPACIAALAEIGVKDLVLMGKCRELFDHRNPNTVIGTSSQFLT